MALGVCSSKHRLEAEVDSGLLVHDSSTVHEAPEEARNGIHSMKLSARD